MGREGGKKLGKPGRKGNDGMVIDQLDGWMHLLQRGVMGVLTGLTRTLSWCNYTKKKKQHKSAICGYITCFFFFFSSKMLSPLLPPQIPLGGAKSPFGGEGSKA